MVDPPFPLASNGVKWMRIVQVEEEMLKKWMKAGGKEMLDLYIKSS